MWGGSPAPGGHSGVTQGSRLMGVPRWGRGTSEPHASSQSLGSESPELLLRKLHRPKPSYTRRNLGGEGSVVAPWAPAGHAEILLVSPRDHPRPAPAAGRCVLIFMVRLYNEPKRKA